MYVPYGLNPILAHFFIFGIKVKAKSVSDQLSTKTAKTKKARKICIIETDQRRVRWQRRSITNYTITH